MHWPMIIALPASLLFLQACNGKDKDEGSEETPVTDYVPLNFSAQRLNDNVVNTIEERYAFKPVVRTSSNEYVVKLEGPDYVTDQRIPFGFYGGFLGSQNMVYGDDLRWDNDQVPNIFIDRQEHDLAQPVTEEKRSIYIEYSGQTFPIGEARLFPYGTSSAWFEPLPVLCEGSFADVCKIEVRVRDDGTNLHGFSLESGEPWLDKFRLELRLTLKLPNQSTVVFQGVSGKD